MTDYAAEAAALRARLRPERRSDEHLAKRIREEIDALNALIDVTHSNALRRTWRAHRRYWTGVLATLDAPDFGMKNGRREIAP